ncbi:alpha/beta hydrolase family protein [Siphonobacter curvatus]|uniref:Alpha/beta hydrolase n=1 Tax=Siphonobacter curvatus TaxID=2094562 RepID=A0A2S7IQH5_9BACT|nr:prolyl oligopeptidase family serine peptidase [Siphonobacter curvatus]PQA59964.1 alpha/beta hydrolase [Siphonobacter curvatus]
MKSLTVLLLGLSTLAFAQEPKPFHEEEVGYWNTKDSVQLKGTLTLPSQGKNFPAVILITGSGPQDRDETILGHKPFKAIAEYLGSRGYAVLRYDDRGGGKMNKTFINATIDNFIKDAEASLDYLKTRKEINPRKIGMLGHSEGGSIAPGVAAQRKDVAFVILMAAPGRSMVEVMRQQNRDLFYTAKIDSAVVETYVTEYFDKVFPAFATQQDTAQLSGLIRERIGFLRTQLSPNQLFVFGIPPKEDMYVKQVVANYNGEWFRRFITFDPVPSLQKMTVPTLALNGTKDVQVNADMNLQGIENALQKAGNKRYKIVRLEGLNHLMLPAKTGLPQEYAAIKGDIDPTFLEAVYEWLQKEVR